MSIGIGLPGGRVKTIIDRNTPLPARKQYGLATTKDGQTEFELVVYQGESGVAAESEYLGTLRLTGLPPGPRGMVKIAVSFELGRGVPPHRDRARAQHRPAGAGGDVREGGAERGAPEARAGGRRPEGRRPARSRCPDRDAARGAAPPQAGGRRGRAGGRAGSAGSSGGCSGSER